MQNVILTLTLVRSCQTRVLDSYTFLHLQVKLMFFVQFLSSSSPMCFFLRFAVWPPPVFPVLRLFPVLPRLDSSIHPASRPSVPPHRGDRGSRPGRQEACVADRGHHHGQRSGQITLRPGASHRAGQPSRSRKGGRSEGRTTESLHGRESGGHRFWQESGQFRWIKSLFRSWKILNRT